MTGTPLNPVQELYACMNHADAVLLAQTPALMMPRLSGLSPLGINRRRYVVASDGLYVQSRTIGLDCTLPIQSFPVALPFGKLDQSIVMAAGLIPADIYQELRRRAVARCPDEWAALVLFNQGSYEIIEPPVLYRSRGEISYSTVGVDTDLIVLDIHSHGTGSPSFSEKDNRSDRHGTYFASVLGFCRKETTVRAKSRVVIDGMFFELDWSPWEES